MADDWHKLGDFYAESPVLIGDVDCTSYGKDLCESFEVSGYPTIKYFADGDMKGQDYNGGRSYDELKQFAEESLEIQCVVSDPGAACSEKEKAYIEKMKAKSASDRGSQIKRLDGMKDNSMKPELKRWLFERLRILKQFEGGDEL